MVDFTPASLSGPDRDAAAFLTDLFTQYGLGSLAPKIIQFIQEGYSADTISLLLQDTQEYKVRFAGNEARRAAGLAVLSPGEYLQVEAGYRQALQAAGVPPGYFDANSDFQRYIELDISPEEISKRAQAAVQLAFTVDPLQRQVLAEFGIQTGDIAAYYLNPAVAVPQLERQVQTALLGAERVRIGETLDAGRAESLAQRGITVEKAREGYAAIAENLPDLSKLASIEGSTFTVGDLEAEVFDQSAEAAERRKGLASRERGRFSGRAATGQGTLKRERTFQ